LTHSPEALANYYGEQALAGLRAVGEVVLNKNPVSLEGEALIAAAAGCDLIVSYRQSPGPAQVFERLPKLIAFLRARSTSATSTSPRRAVPACLSPRRAPASSLRSPSSCLGF
jgi:hypothetical protein